MAKHDLTNALEKSFTFSIEDKEYEFRKPTVREMREVAKKFAAVEKEEDDDKKDALAQEALDHFYTFVTPMNHDLDIKSVLDDQPMSVQAGFNEMIRVELGVQSSDEE